MIAWYLQRGHSLRELLQLTTAEKLFYAGAMHYWSEVTANGEQKY